MEGTKANKRGGKRESPLCLVTPSPHIFRCSGDRAPKATVDFAHTLGDFILLRELFATDCLGPCVAAREPCVEFRGPETETRSEQSRRRPGAPLAAFGSLARVSRLRR